MAAIIPVTFFTISFQSRSASSPLCDVPDVPLFSAKWVEEAIGRMIQQFFTSCKSISQLEMLLKCLDELSVLRFFECKGRKSSLSLYFPIFHIFYMMIFSN